MPVEPVVIAWEFQTPADLETTWNAFSDTDRFNHVAGVNFHYRETAKPDGSTVRTGSTSRLGLTVEWEELPFAFRAPHWYRSIRRFTKGPMARMTTSLLLKVVEGPRGPETRIFYRLEALARSALTRPIVHWEISGKTKTQLDEVLRALVTSLNGSGRGGDFWQRPPPLKREADQLLKAAVKHSQYPAVARRLEHFLRTAPLRDQFLISPPQLSQLFDVFLDDIVITLLTWVELGALSLRLDILCPSCRGAKSFSAEQTPDAGQVHCTSCNIYFDRSFPNNVVVHFQPSRAVRAETPKVECLGSPARLPHVIGLDHVEVGAAVPLSTTLRAGVYQVRTLPPLGSPALLHVYDDQPRDPLEVLAGRVGISPKLSRRSPGFLNINFINQTDRKLQVMLERLEHSGQVMTAGVMLEEFPDFQQFMPRRYFSETETYPGAILAVSPFEIERGRDVMTAMASARLLYRSTQGSVAVFDQSLDALRVLSEAFRSDSKPQFGLSIGTVNETRLDGEFVPLGQTVESALCAMRSAGPGTAAIPSKLLTDALVEQLVASSLAYGPAGFCGTDGESLVWLTPKT